MEIQDFISQMLANPLLFIAVVLTLGVILVNGWTDAPNAIATCVVTRCMSARAAIIMAAIFNFLGVYVMTMLSPKVAQTITNMVDFGSDPDKAIIALSAAMFAIVTWASVAFIFGIPTSESHALIAGLTGSAIALHGTHNSGCFSFTSNGYSHNFRVKSCALKNVETKINSNSNLLLIVLLILIFRYFKDQIGWNRDAMLSNRDFFRISIRSYDFQIFLYKS